MNDETDPTLLSGMIRLLAGTLILRCKARFFAWSLTRDKERAIRDIFYKDYDFLDDLCDEIAIRIADLGGAVPGAYSTLASISSIKENDVLPAMKMIAQLAEDHRQLVFDTQFVVAILKEAPDKKTADLMVNAVSRHESYAENLEGLIKPDGERMN